MAKLSAKGKKQTKSAIRAEPNNQETSVVQKGKKPVKFSIKAEPTCEVYVAGTFNDWNPRTHKLTCEGEVHCISILLDSGRHEYKFVISDTWHIDPECSEWVPNGHGSLNSVIVVE